MSGMPWTTREQIGAAFWNLVSVAPGFRASSRRFVHWDQVSGADQLPFMTLIKTGEQRVRQDDGTAVIHLFYHLLVYTMAGDPTVASETQMNDLLDAVDQAVQPTGTDMQGRQTLGGLVYWCQPRGRVFVDAGDTDGKGVAAVPFEILAPWFV